MTTQIEILVPFVLGIFILVLLFQSPLFALSVAVGAGVFYLVFAGIIR